MITVSPPDKNGYCSLGVSVDYTSAAARQAGLVIAEVNPTMPRTLGNSFIHVDEIDFFVPVDLPIYELHDKPLSEVDIQIGRNVANLLEDGCSLQLGIGGIPNAVLSNLNSFQDLGIHSEMISNGVMELVETGVITGKLKSLHTGKIIVTFMMGSREFYDWVHDNPVIEMHPVDYTNNPFIIAQNEKMVSINSGLEVDLMGQVAADTMGTRQFSGVGGQVDFVRGASLSAGGKSIIALPSTAKGGEVSRIVTALEPGTSVTTSRNDVDYIVTEFGAISLRGKSVQERIKGLINVAHPDFRESLERGSFEMYG
jgi:4-hydroxybutyrate CoA-transferase